MYNCDLLFRMTYCIKKILEYPKITLFWKDMSIQCIIKDVFHGIHRKSMPYFSEFCKIFYGRNWEILLLPDALVDARIGRDHLSIPKKLDL